jgi:streptogrisin D
MRVPGKGSLMTSIRRFGAALGVAMATVAVVAVLPASAAQATPEQATSRKPTQTVEVPERYRKQMPVTQAAIAIRAEIERGDYPGYAGIELEDDQVAVWWKDKVPEQVMQAIDKARSIAPVRVGAARHSLRELQAAGASIRATLAAEQQPRIKYAVDGSRVTVGVRDKAGLHPIPPVAVPVEVVEQSPKEFTSRRDDWAPWSGGADMLNSRTGGRCTTGFPVTNGTNRFLLTAGHCGNPFDGVVSGAGKYIGLFWFKNAQHDLAMVFPPDGVDPTIYIGGVDSNAVVHVDGWDWVFPGEYLCQSGGSSARAIGGPVCNLRVERFNTDPGDAVEARQIYGQVAVRPGDSGGPVYTGSASGGVIAKGINSYCYLDVYLRDCGSVFGFQDFGTAQRDYGIWIAQ